MGTLTYVRSDSGGAITSVSALTVNAAAEAVDYRCLAAPGGAAVLPELLTQVVTARTRQGEAVVIAGDSDTALPLLARTGAAVAAVRRAPDGDSRAAQIRWCTQRPADGSAPRRLIGRLAERRLLYEPLDRLRRITAMAQSGLTHADLAPPLELYLRQDGPIDWPHPFLPYQLEGIRALVERRELLLADDMGLGKTVQAAAALRILVRTGAMPNALIVAPASILSQWYRALREWSPDLRISTVRGSGRAWRWRVEAHVYLVSFETLRADFSVRFPGAPATRTWGVVILDEAQKIKNRDVDAAQACKRLPRERSWALTGTPLENQVDDLRSICEFLVRDAGSGRALSDPQRLRETHRKLQLRRRKVDVLSELPEKTVIEVPVQLGPRQRESYERAEREGVMWLRQLGQTITITHVLELITRLKQVCNFCPETGDSAKFEDLEARLGTVAEAGNRALVFTQYTDDQFGAAALARRLSALHPEVYTGGLSADEKDAVLRRFGSAEDPRPLILSLRAGGFGLNLQEASYVFHFDRWWNPAVESQAEDRAHRMGQQQPVTVYAYLCRDTIEERIQQILTAKGALFRDWIDDVSIHRKATLSEDEIFGLVGLSAPRAARR